MRRQRRRKRRGGILSLGVCAALVAGVLLAGGWAARQGAPNPPTTGEDGAVILSQGGRVELQWQDPELPNGCEVTSLAMLLGWAGCPVDKVELYEGYLPRQDLNYDESGAWSGDPEEVYVGDAASETQGWYCMEKPVAEAGNAWLAQAGSPQRLEIMTGLSQRELEGLLDEGSPLVAWVTLDYEAPTLCATPWRLPDGSFYYPYCNLHCVLVVGRGEEGYLVANPLEGWQWVDSARFWASFEEMGLRCVGLAE